MMSTKAVFLLSVVLASLAAVSGQVCSGLQNGTEGSFQTTNYPNNYPSNEFCLLYISTNTGRVVIEFSDFATNIGDVVTIRDGVAQDSPLIATLAGTYGPLLFETTGTQASIQFKTDGSGTNRGFKGTWREYFGTPIITPTTPSPPTTPGPRNCGANVTGTAGTFESNNYPGEYPDSSRCIWRITAQNQDHVAFLIEDLHLEPTYDTLVFHDGPLLTSPILFTADGDLRNVAIATSQKEATVIFTSDSSIAGTSQGSGFRVSWREAALTTAAPGRK